MNSVVSHKIPQVSLIEAALTSYRLHESLQANLLQTIENFERMHGKILYNLLVKNLKVYQWTFKKLPNIFRNFTGNKEARKNATYKIGRGAST